MKHLMLLTLLCGGVSILHAQSTAFTYQGRLVANGSPANGSHDFQFTLFNAESGGDNVDDPVTSAAVGVTNGLFTVLLGFPANANLFNGQDRWLDVAVRPAGNGTFTRLTPRQPITPTPYAVTALKVPGVDGHALHAADGSPANALFVDDAGNVGVGTTVPVTRLHVASGPGENPPPRVESSGADGFGAGWDFYHGAAGKGYVGVPDSGAAFAPGELLLFGGPGTKASLWAGGGRSLTADTNGNVGIGTTTPDAKLDVRGIMSVRGGMFLQGSMDVRGDIRMGSQSELRAASSPENLRIVRGKVGQNGQVVAGIGFQVFHQPIETPYTVTFTPPFEAPPVVVATIERSVHDGYVVASSVTAGSATFTAYASGGGIRPSDFNFIAIGPR